MVESLLILTATIYSSERKWALYVALQTQQNNDNILMRSHCALWKRRCNMDYTKKPTVFIFGEKKKDAPPVPKMTREQMEKCIKESEKYVRQNNNSNKKY